MACWEWHEYISITKHAQYRVNDCTWGNNDVYLVTLVTHQTRSSHRAALARDDTEQDLGLPHPWTLSQHHRVIVSYNWTLHISPCILSSSANGWYLHNNIVKTIVVVRVMISIKYIILSPSSLFGIFEYFCWDCRHHIHGELSRLQYDTTWLSKQYLVTIIQLNISWGIKLILSVGQSVARAADGTRQGLCQVVRVS